MLHRQAHLSDEQLLLLADREATPRRATKADQHLNKCQPCRARMATLESTLAAFVSLHEETIAARVLRAANHRSNFRVKLAREAERGAVGPRLIWQPMVVRQFASACIAITIVASGAWAIRSLVVEPVHRPGIDQLAIALPRKRLTPGAIRPVHLDELCRGDDAEEAPAGKNTPGPMVEQQVFTEYGLSAAAHSAYELDYLITPELGGSADIHNLWPEPYSATTWNAHVKDQLEDHLHALVCHGQLPLGRAQDEIATDWIAAYKRHFHTETPLSNAAVIDAIESGRPGSEVKSASTLESPAS